MSSTEKNIKPNELVVACVTENHAKYLGQTSRLLRSIRWFGGGLSQSRMVVCAVEAIDAATRTEFETLGADVRIVERFDERNPYGNQLQSYDQIWGGREDMLLLLDCDTIVVQDPLPFLQRDVFQGTIAPLPTVSHEMFERIFKRFGLLVPPADYVTGFSSTPTIPYFSTGVLAMPVPIARELVPVWRRYHARLAHELSQVDLDERDCHQVSLSLALVLCLVPIAEMPARMNYQINSNDVSPSSDYLEIDPVIAHYHDRVNEDGSLLPTSATLAQHRIDRFNERLREDVRVAKTRTSGKVRVTASAAMETRQIAVLGMHRSGTSVLAQLIHLMGANAGEEKDFPRADFYNPTGYWEHRAVHDFNEETLQTLGASWFETASLDLSQLGQDTTAQHRERASDIVRSLEKGSSIVIKDPRLATLYPLWRAVLDRPVCVLIWRAPFAVARSLKVRDEMPLHLGLALWEQYNRSMLSASAGVPRILVSYEDLVTDPVAFARSLHSQLTALGATDLVALTAEQIEETVDSTLNRSGGREPESEDHLDEEQKELLDALRSGKALQRDVVSMSPSKRELLSTLALQWNTIQSFRSRERDMAGHAGNIWKIVADEAETRATLRSELEQQVAAGIHINAVLHQERASTVLLRSELERAQLTVSKLSSDLNYQEQRGATAAELDGLLASVFQSRTWRVGHLATAPLRLLRPGAQSAADRWKALRRE